MSNPFARFSTRSFRLGIVQKPRARQTPKHLRLNRVEVTVSPAMSPMTLKRQPKGRTGRGVGRHVAR